MGPIWHCFFAEQSLSHQPQAHTASRPSSPRGSRTTPFRCMAVGKECEPFSKSHERSHGPASRACAAVRRRSPTAKLGTRNQQARCVIPLTMCDPIAQWHAIQGQESFVLMHWRDRADPSSCDEGAPGPGGGCQCLERGRRAPTNPSSDLATSARAFRHLFGMAFSS